VGTSWEKVLKLPEIALNKPKIEKSSGKNIIDNQVVMTIYEKTKKIVGKTWENYN
jgi:hypothetical protein